MQYGNFSIFADFCQATTVLLSLVAYIPQWLVILKRQSSEHVALWTWILWLGSSVLSLIYALELTQQQGSVNVLLIAALFNVCFLMLTVGLILRYRHPANVSIRC